MNLPPIKTGTKILWLHEAHGERNVESGDVLFTVGTFDGPLYCLCWLDGHHSRNDDIHEKDVLAIWDPAGEQIEFPGWSGTGYLTDAGRKFKEELNEQR